MLAVPKISEVAPPTIIANYLQIRVECTDDLFYIGSNSPLGIVYVFFEYSSFETYDARLPLTFESSREGIAD